MSNEKVLILLKPDGVELNLQSILVSKLKKQGLTPIEIRELTFSKQLVCSLYSKYRKKWFFERVISYLTSGKSFLIVCEGPNATFIAKSIRGNSYDGTGLRGEHSSHEVKDPDGRKVLLKNVMHVSDPEDFEREVVLFKTQIL